MKLFIIVCLTILLGISSQNSNSEVQFKRTLKLKTNDRATNDEYGFAVTIAGNIKAVGARNDDNADIIIVAAPQEFPTEITPTGYQIGTAYVFLKNQGEVDNWGKVMTLKPAGRVYDDDAPHTDNDLHFAYRLAYMEMLPLLVRAVITT